MFRYQGSIFSRAHGLHFWRCLCCLFSWDIVCARSRRIGLCRKCILSAEVVRGLRWDPLSADFLPGDLALFGLADALLQAMAQCNPVGIENGSLRTGAKVEIGFVVLLVFAAIAPQDGMTVSQALIYAIRALAFVPERAALYVEPHRQIG